MVWTRSAYPSLNPRVHPLTKKEKKENYKHLSLLFRGYKPQQLGVKSALSNAVFLKGTKVTERKEEKRIKQLRS